MKNTSKAIQRIMGDIDDNMVNKELFPICHIVVDVEWSRRREWIAEALVLAMAPENNGVCWIRSGDSLVLVTVDEDGYVQVVDCKVRNESYAYLMEDGRP